LHLAAIRVGDAAKALALIAQLLSRNEPALRIVATLTISHLVMGQANDRSR